MTMQALIDCIASMALTGDAQRIFHGRGGLHAGCEHLTLDYYPPVFVLTSFVPLGDDSLEIVQNSLGERWQKIAPSQKICWVYQCRSGAQSMTRLMHGQVPEPHLVQAQGAQYLVHVLKGQNHGLFLDMSEGRRWVREHIEKHPRSRVLNLFAYTCAFSVVALQAGAKHVVNVDMSHGALGIGQKNHQINGVGSGASFLAHDIFSSWGKISRNGPYDLIIIDPPSYQKGSFVAAKDYARLMRRLPDLLMPGGYALLCLNAPELESAFLIDQMKEFAPQLKFEERIANPVEFADISPERSLKVQVYKADCP